MDFRTKVEIKWNGDKISHNHSLLFLGSCFAQEIGEIFSTSKFNSLVNPFGVLYNPLSISKSLEKSLDCTPYTINNLFKDGNLFHSFDHHSTLSDTDATRMLNNINEKLMLTCQKIRSSHFIFLTFGTSWVYELKANNEVVSNCHKLPASTFTRRRAGVKELSERMTETIRKILEVNSGVKFVLTVSPIRHLKDGAHGNNLSKSVLLLMCDELANSFPDNAIYFPSYEILLDELRDYRFYADDMTHPSKKAVEYIWEQIKEVIISLESRNIIKEWGKIRQGILHRRMSADVESYKLFLENLLKSAESFADKYQNIDITNEIAEIKNLYLNI